MSSSSLYSKLDHALTSIARAIEPIFLLIVRLFWGWQFFQTGLGKLKNLDRTTSFFESLHIPLPHLNAIMASSVECVGGILLMLGLASRVITVPLIGVLVVAYCTAETDALHALFSDPDKFTSATPFLFLFATVTIFIFGPGKISVDGLVFKKTRD